MTAQTILPANSVVDTGYNVANSCMFDTATESKMEITFGSAGTSLRKATFSSWLKRSNLTVDEELIFRVTADSGYFNIAFSDTDTIKIKQSISSTVNLEFVSNQKFRDPSAWLHMLVVFDTTQSTEANRVKIYINGTQVTSWSTSTYPDQNTDMLFGAANLNIIASSGGGNYFGGYLAEMCYCDGQSLTPTSFGEFDEDSGIWKPIDVSGLTFGTNGFYLDMEDATDFGQDVSGNTNDWTENNLAATDQATDTCTNNFTTWNSLNFNLNANTLSNGNTKMNGTADAAYPNSITSIGMPKSGKWYAEFKDVGTEGFALGIADMPTFINALRTDTSATIFTTGGSGAAILRNAGDVIISGSETSGVTPTFSQNDIAMIAYDADNGAIYFGSKGTFGSVGGVVGDPTSGASRTGAINISGQSWLIASQEVGFIVGSFSGSKFSIIEANFGNPFFAITSGNADGDGSGDFEYAVPSGYFALCTKNLAEYG